MATAVAVRSAREYLRVSKGKGRAARSITDQHKDNIAAEKEHGPWTWGEAYADTGSASKFARKTRDDFDRLMGELTSGEFGEPGTVLVLWEISRLARETGKGVALVDAAESGGYLIHVTSLDRTFNPSNYGDRHSLISGINDAEKEARLLSVRTLRGVTSALDEGRPHGKTPFGYARDYELIDGRPRPVRQYPDPVEAPLIQELFRRVLGSPEKAPESIRSVAMDWERRGIVSRQSGATFSPQNMRQMLMRKAYIGIRVHAGTERPGNWDPIIERETFDAVQRMLADPTRKTYTTTSVRHVLTGTLRCDMCDGRMSVSAGGNRHKLHPAYVCYAYGHLAIDKAETDAFLIGDAQRHGVLLAYLSRPDVAAGLSSPDNDSEVSAVRTELATAQANLEAFEAEDPETPAEARLIARKISKLEMEISELEGRERALTAPNPLDSMFEIGPGAAERWEAAEVTSQRAVAALLFSPEVLGQVRVGRVADSPSEAVQDRVRFVVSPTA
ncbi:recombinase family protein [Streptomyces sp. NPDC001982]|uniref:recombinase family protein n=1 Tax=Streptomyces sp. NPDC001982 TaxID=3154405 RepID=UPI00332D45FC